MGNIEKAVSDPQAYFIWELPLMRLFHPFDKTKREASHKVTSLICLEFGSIREDFQTHLLRPYRHRCTCSRYRNG